MGCSDGMLEYDEEDDSEEKSGSQEADGLIPTLNTWIYQIKY